jgi:hypothetical protein
MYNQLYNSMMNKRSAVHFFVNIFKRVFII